MGFNSTLPLERFPAVTDGQGMADFLRHLFEPESDILHAYYVVMYVAAGGTCVLLLAASGILALRVWRGMMWILQVYPTSHGSYVIPNSIMSLVILLLCYVIVYTAYALKQIDLFRSFDQTGIFLWRSLPWVPLWSGAWFSAWGTFSSFPDALRISKSGSAVGYLLHPTVWNIGVWGAPLLLIASLAPTIGLSQHHYSQQLGRWDEWKAAYAAPGADLESLRTFGLDIWLEVTRSYWYYSITMWMWCGWALVCLIAYFSISLHTLLRLRAQVKIADKKQQELQTFYLFPSQAEHVIPAPETPSEARTPEKLSAPTFSTANNKLTAPQNRPRTGDTTNEGGVGGGGGTDVRPAALYPPLRQPPQTSQRTHQVSAATRRGELLRNILRNIIVQYLAINFGASCFALAAGGIGGGAYSASRTNDLAPHQVIWNFLVAGVNILCGLALVIAVALRSLDSSLTIREDMEDGPFPGLPSSGAGGGKSAGKNKGWSRTSGSGPSRATETIHISPPSTSAGPKSPSAPEIEESVISSRSPALLATPEFGDGLGVTRSDSLRESVSSQARLVSSTEGSTAVGGGSSNGDDETNHVPGSKSGRSQILGSIKRARASTSATARAQEERALAALPPSGSTSGSPHFSSDSPYSNASLAAAASSSAAAASAISSKRQSVRRTPSVSRNASGGAWSAAAAHRPGTGTSDVAYATPFGSVPGDSTLTSSPWLDDDLFKTTQPLTPLGREVLDATRRETSQRSRYGNWRDGAPTTPLPPPPVDAQRRRHS